MRVYFLTGSLERNLFEEAELGADLVFSEVFSGVESNELRWAAFLLALLLILLVSIILCCWCSSESREACLSCCLAFWRTGMFEKLFGWLVSCLPAPLPSTDLVVLALPFWMQSVLLMLPLVDTFSSFSFSVLRNLSIIKSMIAFIWVEKIKM